MTSLRTLFLRFDDHLASFGVPRCTTWWRDGIGEWLDAYEAGGALDLFACVGRGAAKSTALYKLALFFTLFGDFVVPPGERHFAVVLSRLKDEASKGLGIIASWLRLLGVAHSVAGDVIELADQPRGIRVVAASVAATSGWRAYFVAKDERSKWPSGGAEGQDAEEIDASATSMTANHARAPNIAAGSAWVAHGDFYEAIVGGTNASRVVLGPAPTWIAAPHIREEDLRAKQRNARLFDREFRCVFVAGESAVFPIEDIDAAIQHPRHDGLRLRKHLVIDAAGGGKDAFTWGIVGWVNPPRGADWRPYLELTKAGEVSRDIARNHGAKAVVAFLAGIAHEHGCTEAHGDQKDAQFIRDIFSDHGITFYERTWTAKSKPPAVERVASMLRERAIALPADPAKMRAELVSFTERIAPSGQFTYEGRGAHDDYVSILVTSMMASLGGQLVNEEPDHTLLVGKCSRSYGSRHSRRDRHYA